jgi:hypothetical protein
MKKERKPLFDVPTEHEKEWQGMPEFKQEDCTSFQQIIVHFKSEEDVQKFAELIGRSLSYKSNSIWYPHVPRKNLLNRKCIDDES